jgi:hypothetical protein
MSSRGHSKKESRDYHQGLSFAAQFQSGWVVLISFKSISYLTTKSLRREVRRGLI